MVATAEKTQTQTLTIVDYSLEQLETMINPKNPRWMPEQQMEALTASLGQFGLVEPLIVNTANNQIVGGHQRLAAAKLAGETTLPAVLVNLDPAKETALNLSLNKIKGYWDYEKLAAVLNDIEPDHLIATGFTDAEADSIVASYAASDEEISDDEEDYDDGIVDEVRNRTEAEVQNYLESTEKVQFGMFAKHVPTSVYTKWVEWLESKSEVGSSPAALGAVVAELLGIDVSQPQDETEASAEETVDYAIDDVGEAPEDE